MGVVSPLTAALTAGVPLVAGLLLGDRPGGLAMIGVLLGVAAVVFGSRDPNASSGRLDPRVLAATVAAGAAFGAFFILLSRADPDAGMWPLLSARAASLTLLAGTAAALRRRPYPVRAAVVIVIVSGVLDMLANIAYLLAVHSGLLSVTAVLASLYPLSTVLLSRVVLGERLHRVQQVGVILALTAVVLVAL
jgi:drug/metabolite transporter (DMT)-like permease